MSEDASQLIGKGYVQVYTGKGKGKTTAALGLAFRAMGCGARTYVGQFMKGQKYSELDAALKVPEFITIEQFGKDTFVHVKYPPQPEDIELVQKGLTKVKQAIKSRKYNIVVLDEITTAFHFNLLSIEDMLDLIKNKPDGIELIFTGRYAPKELIEAADLVTEMTEIKHYYQKNVQARQGIEK
jgi:cob(I)alamin adenosyltransferase